MNVRKPALDLKVRIYSDLHIEHGRWNPAFDRQGEDQDPKLSRCPMIKPLRKRAANLPSKLSKAEREKRRRIVQEARDKAVLPKSGRTLKISDTATGSGKIRFAQWQDQC